ncbi:hypothetical protein PMAYCL1PPCAC_00377, partial [Pristionchus mayeri]
SSVMLALFLLLSCWASIVESRVSFATSEVIDDVDLKGSNLASFRCYAGCRVYSPTQNKDIIMKNNNGNEFGSLADLADLTPGKVYELPESADLYWLSNKGAPDPSFVFYAVEKGAMNYDSKVLYLTQAKDWNITHSTDTKLTIMSTTGAIYFSNFLGDYSNAVPTVYAVGADSISSPDRCIPVYKPISASTIPQTSFPVNSPIATINFNGVGSDQVVLLSANPYKTTATGKDVTAVYVSPGYVGCNNGDDSLYTHLPLTTGFGSSITATDSSGLKVVIDGHYSIANEADALTVSVNGDGKKLYGKNGDYSKTYDDVTSVKVDVNWAKKEGSKDRFALQIDVISNGGVQATTTKDNLMTTTSASSLGMLAAIIMTTLALC